MASPVIMAIGLMVVISSMGISIGPMLAGLGIMGFIVGFALQDTLSNFASGIMILAYRPFDVGDTVDAGGVFGKVADMSLVTTTVMTFDNQTLIVPNSKIWGGVIKNTTYQNRRRVDMKFRVSFSENAEGAEQLLRAVVDEHPAVLPESKATIELDELGDYAMEFVGRPWVSTADYWRVRWDLTRRIKERFDAEGIEIPVRPRGVV